MNEIQASEAVEQFIGGLNYPITREEILDRGDEAKLSDDVMTALSALPSREYADAADVTRELNAT